MLVKDNIFFLFLLVFLLLIENIFLFSLVVELVIIFVLIIVEVEVIKLDNLFLVILKKEEDLEWLVILLFWFYEMIGNS